MKKPLFFLTWAILATVSCNEPSESANVNSVPSTEPIQNLNIQTEHFSEIDSSGILIFPLKMGENKNRENSSSYKEMPHEGYWNIVFYNTKTKETNLLTEEKILILDYSVQYKYTETKAINIPKTLNHIFYEVRTEDFNSDKLLNQEDPIYLYVSDKGGNNFRLLSPPGYNLNNWSYIKSTNKIILAATKDSNKNLKFDSNDEISTFELTLDTDEKPVEIFDHDLKTKLKALYDRDWKKINVQ